MNILCRRFSLAPCQKVSAREFHWTLPSFSMEEFFDHSKPNEVMVTGRAWTAADLRRKVSSTNYCDSVFIVILD